MSSPPDNEAGPLGDPASDRCSNCGTPLATDQHYCVNCGERRGRPRFGAPVGPGAVPGEPVEVAPGPPPSRSRFSPGTTLVAGVATLLLAMGVGVLIGENGAGSSGRQVADQTPQVIKINSGGGTTADAGTAGSSDATTRTSNHSSKSSKHHGSSGKSSKSTSSAPKVIHLTKQVDTQITKALHNVTGGDAKTAPPTTQIGGKCQNGEAGCQHGKFTGNFFGG